MRGMGQKNLENFEEKMVYLQSFILNSDAKGQQLKGLSYQVNPHKPVNIN